MNYWVDTHAHIYLDEFDDDRSQMLDRAKQNQISKILMPNIDRTSIGPMLRVEEKYQGICIPMMGLHPCSVNQDFESELYEIESWLSKRKFAAVGEIGTDLYWDKTYWEHQKEAFAIQVNLARKHNLPVVIHCRETLEQTIAMIEQMQDGELTGVFHCFTGNREHAERIIKLNFYLGIGGVATFKNGGLDQVLPHIGVNHIVLETDSPYLAPMPHRGKRNEPSYITRIAEKVSDFTQQPLEYVMQRTTQNAIHLFSL
ncbi:TatD family hydrolase [Oscillatoria amoena NRMC-F 0135]|nr:TatD family hydrolase [Oscillatoria amoena NRMC-F 0135]